MSRQPTYINPLYQYGQDEIEENYEIQDDELIDEIFEPLLNENQPYEEEFAEEVEEAIEEIVDNQQQQLKDVLEQLFNNPQNFQMDDFQFLLDNVNGINVFRNEDGLFEVEITPRFISELTNEDSEYIEDQNNYGSDVESY